LPDLIQLNLNDARKNSFFLTGSTPVFKSDQIQHAYAISSKFSSETAEMVGVGQQCNRLPYNP
jgi:hypothetical protein